MTLREMLELDSPSPDVKRALYQNPLYEFTFSFDAPEGLKGNYTARYVNGDDPYIRLSGYGTNKEDFTRVQDSIVHLSGGNLDHSDLEYLSPDNFFRYISLKEQVRTDQLESIENSYRDLFSNVISSNFRLTGDFFGLPLHGRATEESVERE